MNLAALAVLVVLASGEPGDGSDEAVAQALRAALARDATVITRSAARAPSDDAAVDMAAAEHAGVVGVVSWSDHERRVVLRLAAVGERWSEREVRFDATDVPAERGRTVGFALASMVPDRALAPSPDDSAAARPVSAAPAPAASSASLAASPPVARDLPVEGRSAPLPRQNPLAIDAVGIVVSAPSGYGGGVGGGLALRLPLAGAIGFRAGANARAESIGPAQASSKALGASAGVTFQPWLDDRRRWAVGARASALLAYLDVAHLSSDDTQAAHLSRFQPGLDVALEGTFRIAGHAALVGTLGTEVVFGTTELYVHERRVATLPPAKLLAELGLRVSFP